MVLLLAMATEAGEKRKAPNAAADGQPQVLINGTVLTSEQIAGLEETYGVPIQPGRYWYDRKSGLWGQEGDATAGQIHPNLKLGGKLKADASHGDTGVFINGRELPTQEVLFLQQLGPVLPGRYWMDAQGVGGIEGRPPIFNLGAAIAAQQKKSGGMYSGWNRTTPGGNLGGDGDCTYFNDPSTGSSVMSGNC